MTRIYYYLARFLPIAMARVLLPGFREVEAFVLAWATSQPDTRGGILDHALRDGDASVYLRTIRRLGGVVPAFRVVLTHHKAWTPTHRFPLFASEEGHTEGGTRVEVVNSLLAMGSTMRLLPPDVRK